MSRTARVRSKTGIYHIMLRGINRQDLFEDDEDKQRFIETLKICKEKSGFSLYAYCLMSNHIHLLLKEEKEPISLIIKRISSSYVYYYNWKHSRCGHLFQERFKSEVVEDDSYLLTVLRYIHQNPVKAKIIKEIEKYKWSSYNEYTCESKMVDTNYALAIFAEEKVAAIKSFINFNNMKNEDKCLEYEVIKRIDDREARSIIKKMARVKNLNEIQGFDKEKRDEIIAQIKEIEGLSIRQIARITGLNYNLIQKL